MLAIDTNVLVRLVTRDDPAQTAVAERLLAEHPLFVPLTVLMETEWVLRAGYHWDRARVNAALRALLQLDGVTVERAADALHLASSPDCDAFATFDRALARHLAGAAPVPIRLLSGD